MKEGISKSIIYLSDLNSGQRIDYLQEIISEEGHDFISFNNWDDFFPIFF